MLTRIQKYLVVPTGLLLALCLSASLFLCTDNECLNGNNNDTCYSLITSLQQKDNSSSSQSVGCFNGCSCVCHTPVIPHRVTGIVSSFQPEHRTMFVSFVIPIAPGKSIYHPPKA